VDADLVRALRSRDQRAAESLIAKYQGRACRLAGRITGNPQDAEGIVQEAFWTVVCKIDTFRGDSAFGSWLYRIVANAAYLHLRRLRRRHELPLDDAPGRIDGRGESAVEPSAQVDDVSARTELEGGRGTSRYRGVRVSSRGALAKGVDAMRIVPILCPRWAHS